MKEGKIFLSTFQFQLLCTPSSCPNFSCFPFFIFAPSLLKVLLLRLLFSISRVGSLVLNPGSIVRDSVSLDLRPTLEGSSTKRVKALNLEQGLAQDTLNKCQLLFSMHMQIQAYCSTSCPFPFNI